MAIDSRYKLKTGEEVAYFPPIQNTDNPYLTEAAMHADQANQLKGYLYVVTDVGHFEYKGGTSGTAADYELISGSKSREIKEVTNTTQFTILPEHFTDYILIFTADANEEISLIMPAGISAIEGKVIALSEGNHTLIPTSETGIILAQTAGSKMRTKGKGSKIEILPTTTTGVFAVTGDLAIRDIGGKDIKLRSDNTSSSIFMYDSETNDSLYFELRYDAANNLFKILSDDGLGAVESLSIDRGKMNVNVQALRTLNSTLGITLQTPTGGGGFKKDSGNIRVIATEDNVQFIKIGSSLPNTTKIIHETNINVTTANRPTDFTHDMIVGMMRFDTDLNKPIWWDGTQWVESASDGSGSGLVLGTSSSAAYRGDRGKIAYDHSQSNHAPTNAQKNVNPDWGATIGDAKIFNKPDIPSEIKNITEIANRSYNDLQDLPRGSKILFDSDLENGNYVVKNSDNGKIISFSNVSNASPNVQLDPAILDTGFNLNVKAGYSGKIVTFEATGNTSNHFTVEAGLTGKLRPNGIALLRKSGANVIIGTGEFIKNYELFESPDGTLHKIGVANDGTRTSTPL